MLLRICYRFGEGKKTLLIVAQICPELYHRVAQFLYTTATEQNIATLAKTSTLTGPFKDIHCANFVQHVSLFVPITTQENTREIRDALTNIAHYRKSSPVSTFRLINADLTIADLFSNPIPPCFRKIETLHVCGVSKDENEREATTLTVCHIANFPCRGLTMGSYKCSRSI